MEQFAVILTILILAIIPLMLGYNIAKSRNRNTNKALFVTFLFGWWAVIIMWLVLKTRDANGNLK
jgi:uncharacterized membrane protein